MIKKISTIMIIYFIATICFATDFDFYILNRKYYPTLKSTEVLPNLVNHYRSIHYLIPQSYRIESDGTVSGSIDPYVLKFAQAKSMKILALVTNIDFEPIKVHAFLNNPTAQNNAIQFLLNECKQNNLSGVQFDFEGVHIRDKEQLTTFLQNATNTFHKNHLQVSIAIVPQTEGINNTDFLQRKYDNWTGVYDLKRLGEFADSLTLMAYEQHAKGTTPGPTASYQWVESIIKYALNFVPPEKISLGIPSYSIFWSTDNITGNKDGKITTNVDYLSYKEVNTLINKLNSRLLWDDNNKLHYSVIERHWLYEYLFVEDYDSFKEKMKLVKKYHLHGVSVFKLGNEDPRIWRLVNAT